MKIIILTVLAIGVLIARNLNVSYKGSFLKFKITTSSKIEKNN
ncbi:hypothetical protein NE686_18330 [Tissierella carlieri]|uniref:Uncharacterized protein n=1 Tax=Tissierella carlieri TaxID=689904 RepID=A0ABT1SFL3_9FIRM|nr:hypothetical protein [Tissierella carlieri]MCQ4925065.1 hypothetical protein [Tissierella carlieri]